MTDTAPRTLGDVLVLAGGERGEGLLDAAEQTATEILRHEASSPQVAQAATVWLRWLRQAAVPPALATGVAPVDSIRDAGGSVTFPYVVRSDRVLRFDRAYGTWIHLSRDEELPLDAFAIMFVAALRFDWQDVPWIRDRLDADLPGEAITTLIDTGDRLRGELVGKQAIVDRAAPAHEGGAGGRDQLE